MKHATFSTKKKNLLQTIQIANIFLSIQLNLSSSFLFIFKRTFSFLIHTCVLNPFQMNSLESTSFKISSLISSYFHQKVPSCFLERKTAIPSSYYFLYNMSYLKGSKNRRLHFFLKTLQYYPIEHLL